MENHLLSRVKACLLGVQIGDAMGMPWEAMTYEEIMTVTEKRGVTGFMLPPGRKIRGTAHLELGQTTDDWALTRAVARSLTLQGGFSVMDIAREHLVVIQSNDFGWGRTTREALEEIEIYFQGRGGRDPRLPAKSKPGEKTGCGNGVAMKVAPLAIWNAIRYGEFRPMPLLRQVMRLGLMTHPDPRASFTAYVLAALMAKLFVSIKPETISNLQHFVLSEALRAEHCYGHLGADSFGKPLSERLKKTACSQGYWRLADQREDMGKGFHALESVPFSLSVFFHTRACGTCDETSLKNAMHFAVSSGGDTDSNASMIAALFGAQNGPGVFPEEWRNFRPEFAESLEFGEKLFSAAQNARED
jgi:ADP-ribosylglycohydrolase